MLHPNWLILRILYQSSEIVRPKGHWSEVVVHLYLSFVYTVNAIWYNAFNVYRRELAPGTVSLTGDRAQGDDSKHWAYSKRPLRFWQLRRSQSEMDEYSHVCVMLTYTGTLSARQAEGCPIFVCSQYTPKESSNAYTFDLTFSWKLEFWFQRYFGIH